MQRADLQRAMHSVLASHDPEVAVAWLFGSRARGTERANSDVDVGVVFMQPRPRTLMGLPTELEAALGARLALDVQVVDLERASVDLVHRVLLEGRLLFERDPRKRVEFEVRRRREYFDLLPHLRRYTQARP